MCVCVYVCVYVYIHIYIYKCLCLFKGVDPVRPTTQDTATATAPEAKIFNGHKTPQPKLQALARRQS